MIKICPNCGNPLLDLPSMNKRICMVGCKAEWPWKLDPGQKSLLIKGLKGEKK